MSKKTKNRLFVVLFALTTIFLASAIIEAVHQSSEYLNYNITIKLIPVLALTITYRILNGFVFNQLIAAVRISSSKLNALKIWLKAEAFKWIPGGVGNLVAKVQQLEEHTESSRTEAVSITVLDSLANLFAWGLVFFGFAYCIDWISLSQIVKKLPLNVEMLSVLIIIFVTSLLVLCKLFLKKLLSKKEYLFQLFQVKISYQTFIIATLQFSFLVVLNGLTFSYLLSCFANEIAFGIGAAIALNALAWLVGFIAVFAPGGMGAREVVLVTFLSSAYGLEQAVVISILWRLIQLLSEPICLLCLVRFKTISESKCLN